MSGGTAPRCRGWCMPWRTVSQGAGSRLTTTAVACRAKWGLIRAEGWQRAVCRVPSRSRGTRRLFLGATTSATSGTSTRTASSALNSAPRTRRSRSRRTRTGKTMRQSAKWSVMAGSTSTPPRRPTASRATSSRWTCWSSSRIASGSLAGCARRSVSAGSSRAPGRSACAARRKTWTSPSPRTQSGSMVSRCARGSQSSDSEQTARWKTRQRALKSPKTPTGRMWCRG
mmetsp:Transcript_26501/g.53992  ORF Transcript_26501/g.53992 Transcript_26501/m.53992 type:complete len:228 (+) Transcript_26501:124-807(+)